MLSKEQIDYLFDFCLKKRVYFYEIQVELVDHLANAIELKMADNPRLSFEEAVWKEYHQFGIHGFSEIVNQRTKQMDREMKKRFDLLETEGIFTFLILSVIFFVLLRWNDESGHILMGVLVGIMVIKNLIVGVKVNKEIKASGKEFWMTRYLWIGLNSWTLWVAIYFLLVVNEQMFHQVLSSLFIAYFLHRLKTANQFIRNLQKQLIKSYPNVFKFTQ